MRRTVTALVILGLATAAHAQVLQLIDDPSLGAFIDITETGTLVELGDDGEAFAPQPYFGGNLVLQPGNVVIAQNGGMSFGAAAVLDLYPENWILPSPFAFSGGQAILSFWDDIDDKDGDVRFQSMIDRMIVQWNLLNYDGHGGTLICQVQVFPNYDTTGVYAQCLYVTDPPGGVAGDSATVGYQDGGAGYGTLQYSYDAPGAVKDGTVLSLVIAKPAASIPTASEWSLITLAGALLVAGALVIRRRAAPA